MTNERRIVLLAQLQDVASRLELGDLDRLVQFAEALKQQKLGKRQQRRSRHSKPPLSIHPIGF